MIYNGKLEKEIDKHHVWSDLSNKRKRCAVYKYYIQLKHGSLGRNVQVRVQKCVHGLVVFHLSSLNGQYTGFVPSNSEE